jgi:branched-chain amino acid transport system permease protein
VGGFMLAKLLDAAHVPFPVGLLFAGLVTVPIGLLVALPALRVRGVNLAIITLGAGVAIDTFLFRNEQISGGLAGVSVPSPTLFGLDLGISGETAADYPRLAFGLAALATFAVLAVVVVNLRRSPTGSHCLALRSNERAASAIGISPAGTKMLIFAVSAFIAGTTGGLIGYQQGRLSPESFSIFVSLMLLSIAYIGGIATVRGAIFAGLMLAPGGLAFTALDRWFELGRYQPLVAGVGVILSAILNPDGVMAKPRQHRRRRAGQATASVPRPQGSLAPAHLVGGAG